MRLLNAVIAVVVLMHGVAGAAPFVGQSVIYREDSTHTYVGQVTGVVDSDEVDVVVMANGTIWSPDGLTLTAEASPAWYISDVTRGSGDGQWLENPFSRVVVQSTPSLTLNGSGVQLNTAADTEYTATVKIDLTTTLIAGMGGTVHLLCDANSTPTTEVAMLAFSHGLGVAQSASLTGTLGWRAVMGDYCRVTTTSDVGSPTFTLVRQRAQTLD